MADPGGFLGLQGTPFFYFVRMRSRKHSGQWNPPFKILDLPLIECSIKCVFSFLTAGGTANENSAVFTIQKPGTRTESKCSKYCVAVLTFCALYSLQEELLQSSEWEKQIVVQQLQSKNQVRNLP